MLEIWLKIRKFSNAFRAKKSKKIKTRLFIHAVNSTNVTSVCNLLNGVRFSVYTRNSVCSGCLREVILFDKIIYVHNLH